MPGNVPQVDGDKWIVRMEPAGRFEQGKQEKPTRLFILLLSYHNDAGFYTPATYR
jgi:hypothetical protein